MIEMRWLQRSTGERIMNRFGFYEDETETVLQFRQIVNQTRWSDWTTVPVQQQSTDTSKYYLSNEE